MKPVSVLFSRERSVGGEKISLGFQADIGADETPEQALASVQNLVEEKLSALAPSPEEQQRRNRETEAINRRNAIEQETAARLAELQAEFGDVLSAPVATEAPKTEETAPEPTTPAA